MQGILQAARARRKEETSRTMNVRTGAPGRSKLHYFEVDSGVFMVSASLSCGIHTKPKAKRHGILKEPSPIIKERTGLSGSLYFHTYTWPVSDSYWIS